MKKIISFILVFVICLSFCACAAEKTGGSTKTETCLDCNGLKKIQCKTCSGAGTVDCPMDVCVDGIAGKECTICNKTNGKPDIVTCTACNGSTKGSKDCDTCEGSGIIVNPFTWEKFKCDSCSGSGKTSVKCKTCEGKGIICAYCVKNNPDKVNGAVIYTCKTCNGSSTVTCEDCLGRRNIPCSVCDTEGFNQFNEKLRNNQAQEEKEQTIKDMYGILRSENFFGKDQADKVRTIISETSVEIENKDEILKILDIIEPYYFTKWAYVSGKANLLRPNMPSGGNSYEIKLHCEKYEGEPYKIVLFLYTKNGEESKGLKFDIETDTNVPYFLIYTDYSEKYTVSLKENGNLLIEQLDINTDETINTLELKRITE